jgi:hypothetical protein
MRHDPCASRFDKSFKIPLLLLEVLRLQEHALGPDNFVISRHALGLHSIRGVFHCFPMVRYGLPTAGKVVMARLQVDPVQIPVAAKADVRPDLPPLCAPSLLSAQSQTACAEKGKPDNSGISTTGSPLRSGSSR